MIYIILFSLLVLFIINIFYRILINQDEVVDIKDRMKKLEEESKKHRDDKDKQKEYFSKIMDENRKLTKLSFKPMIVSFLIIMVMLPILSFFYSDLTVPLNQGYGNLTIDKTYDIKVVENNVELSSGGSVAVSCSMPCMKKINENQYKIDKQLVESNGQKIENLRFSRIVAVSPVTIPFIGRELGWIWLYVMLSIPLSIVIKKLLGIKI